MLKRVETHDPIVLFMTNGKQKVRIIALDVSIENSLKTGHRAAHLPAITDELGP